MKISNLNPAYSMKKSETDYFNTLNKGIINKLLEKYKPKDLNNIESIMSRKDNSIGGSNHE